MMQNFNNMNTNEIDNVASADGQINEIISSEKNLSIMINEIVDLISEESNIGKECNVKKQHVLDYLSNHNINSKEIYNLLLNNQSDSDSVFLLGYFNYVGIETNDNFKKAFSLFINAS